MLLSAGWCDSYKGLSLKTADAAVPGSYQASANRGGRAHWVKQYRYNLTDRNIAIVYFSLNNLPLFLRIKIRTSITWRVTYICFCSAVFGLVKMAGSANYTVACAVRSAQTLLGWLPDLNVTTSFRFYTTCICLNRNRLTALLFNMLYRQCCVSGFKLDPYPDPDPYSEYGSRCKKRQNSPIREPTEKNSSSAIIFLLFVKRDVFDRNFFCCKTFLNIFSKLVT